MKVLQGEFQPQGRYSTTYFIQGDTAMSQDPNLTLSFTIFNRESNLPIYLPKKMASLQNTHNFNPTLKIYSHRNLSAQKGSTRIFYPEKLLKWH